MNNNKAGISFLNYSNIFYGICNKYNRNEVLKLQNSVLRLAVNMNNPRDMSIAITNTIG